MEKNKDFTKMQKDYEASLKNVDDLIKKYAKRINGVHNKASFEDYQRNTDMLCILYEEKMQLIRIINTLKNYYNDDFILKDCV